MGSWSVSDLQTLEVVDPIQIGCECFIVLTKCLDENVRIFHNLKDMIFGYKIKFKVYVNQGKIFIRFTDID